MKSYNKLLCGLDLNIKKAFEFLKSLEQTTIYWSVKLLVLRHLTLQITRVHTSCYKNKKRMKFGRWDKKLHR